MVRADYMYRSRWTGEAVHVEAWKNAVGDCLAVRFDRDAWIITVPQCGHAIAQWAYRYPTQEAALEAAAKIESLAVWGELFPAEDFRKHPLGWAEKQAAAKIAVQSALGPM